MPERIWEVKYLVRIPKSIPNDEAQIRGWLMSHIHRSELLSIHLAHPHAIVEPVSSLIKPQ